MRHERRSGLYDGRDARCSASHCSLIQPSFAEFTPPGTRTLIAMTVAASPTETTMNTSMVVNPSRVRKRRSARAGSVWPSCWPESMNAPALTEYCSRLRLPTTPDAGVRGRVTRNQEGLRSEQTSGRRYWRSACRGRCKGTGTPAARQIVAASPVPPPRPPADNRPSSPTSSPRLSEGTLSTSAWHHHQPWR